MPLAKFVGGQARNIVGRTKRVTSSNSCVQLHMYLYKWSDLCWHTTHYLFSYLHLYLSWTNIPEYTVTVCSQFNSISGTLIRVSCLLPFLCSLWIVSTLAFGGCLPYWRILGSLQSVSLKNIIHIRNTHKEEMSISNDIDLSNKI